MKTVDTVLQELVNKIMPGPKLFFSSQDNRFKVKIKMGLALY